MQPSFRVLAAILLGLIAATAASAADQDAIDRAVERGVTHLKSIQQADGTWGYPQVGATALAGLTLLECDVAPKDASVQKAADHVRRASVHLTHTYSLALSILFLDRLGDDADVPIIESLTVRLLAGQNGNGGWTYQCPDVPETEARRLTGLLKQRSELTTRPKSTGTARTSDKAADPKRNATQRKLTDEIRQQLEVINRAAGQRQGFGGGDNSNTQFATLALWVARRHGLPTDGALALIDARFRGSQNGDGGWDYSHRGRTPGAMRGGQSTATMTCAGLLGLAVAHGSAAEAALRTAKAKEGDKPKNGDKVAKVPDPTRDPAVRAGLVALGSSIGHPVGKKRVQELPHLARGGRVYYFLWSLERVAVAFGLKTIGGKDWYGWGSEVLTANQQADGSWQGDFAAGGVDTCFALLFLRRANLARDLTLALRGKIEDPGEVVLSAGGIGGEAIKQRLGLKSALESPDMFGGTTSEGDGPDATQLSRRLIDAAAEKQGQLIDDLRDSKGVVYTDALASAIPRLQGEPAQEGARGPGRTPVAHDLGHAGRQTGGRRSRSPPRRRPGRRHEGRQGSCCAADRSAHRSRKNGDPGSVCQPEKPERRGFRAQGGCGSRREQAGGGGLAGVVEGEALSEKDTGDPFD